MAHDRWAQNLAQRLRPNQFLWECLQRLSGADLPDFYLGAGCLAQTIWNLAHGEHPSAEILDYDLAYFDPDLSEGSEADVRKEAEALVKDLPIRLDVKNQARVHIWYPRRFGYGIRPYKSLEEAIGTWPTTATATALRLDGGSFKLVAPFGLEDLFGLVVRPNRVQITPDYYESKTSRWASSWPRLRVLPWESGVGIPGERHLDSAPA